ncbi:MAG: hypothetical protein IPN17_23760 [Deltaproteobacteria bacterium]|nr:hypothetical protein [Deltaproteobacteria bacterium]MBK8695207.1 hypothetical protein [Deltaproteobacteria bacterium]MBP6832573.1 hypothetical protein [Deltaproteobacteria bacterium]
MFFFLSFLCVALVIGAPTAMWFKTWPDALLRWLPRGQFRDAVVPKFRADGPPMEVRFAALGSWVLGAMFVPGLLMGLLGLVMMGLGLVSIPGLILAGRLFFLGRPLLLGEPGAADRARSLAQFARILNYVVLAICGVGVLSQVPEVLRHGAASNALGLMALSLSVAVYAGISLAHASLLDRAAKAIDGEGVATLAPGGVRIDAQGAAVMPEMSEEMSEEMSDGMSDGMSEEERRRGR